MGLFDNLLKQVDNGLKAVESGALEKRLNQFADSVEKRSKQTDDKLGKIADKPGEILHTAAVKKDALETRVRNVGHQVEQGAQRLQKKD